MTLRNALNIIDTLRNDDESFEPSDIARALEDGEVLAAYDWNQDDIEAAHDLCENIDRWSDLPRLHGGRRENAGRKPTGNVTVALRLTPEEKDKLESCGWSYFVKYALEYTTVEYKVRDATYTACGVCSREFLWCYEDNFDVEASNDAEAWAKVDEIQAKHDAEARKGVDNGEFSEEEFNNAPCYSSCLWKEIYVDGNLLFKIYLDISTRQ